MLGALQQLHGEILGRLDELEQLLRAPSPARAALAQMRLKLTQASGRRRRLLAEVIYPMLEREGAGAERLRALRTQDARLVEQSSQHIACWTLDEIEARWSDYCAAAAQMCSAMRQRIALEKLVLYPLLGTARLSSSAASRS